MGGACSMYGGEEGSAQGFGGETWGKETTGETQAQKGGFTMDLQAVGCGGMDWIKLAQDSSGGGHLWMQ